MIDDAKTLDRLLELALDLDEPARTHFLDSATIPRHLREELAALLHAATTTGALDRLPAAVTAIQAKQANTADNVKAGQQFGSYRLVRLLGEGGMASVWLAERDDLGHQVAVKCLKTGLATEEGKARFLREQQFLAQLQHPSIARLYDVGISSEGVPFIVMEWVDGLTVTRYCDEYKLGIAQRLRLFQKICTAVAYAHQNLVVHRDLKPANILVGADGEPKLLDFGIAKLLDESTEPVTRTGMYLLTPEYAAPEQFNNAAITTATDTYALGAVLYELLSGLRPKPIKETRFGKENVTAVIAPSDALRRLSKKALDKSILASSEKNESQLSELHRPNQIAGQRATTPERLRRTLQGDLDTIVLKALQEEANRRYPTAQAFSEDIERYLQQQPIQARKDAWTYRTSKYLARHAVGVTLTIIVATALLAATTISINQAHRAQIQTQRAEVEAKRAELETKRAQTEAKRAMSVKEFLTNLFEVSDSGLPRDKMPSTEALLEDGIKRVRDEFNDVPEVKFDLLLLLGSIQLTHFRYEQADALLKEAKIIADKKFSPSDEKWLQAQTQWGNLLGRKGDYEAALNQITVAINQYRNSSAHREGSALANALAAQGNAYKRLNRFDEAAMALQEALAISNGGSKEQIPHILTLQSSLADIFIDAQRYDDAETLLRKNVALRRELYGNDNAKYARGLADLATALTQQDKDAEAEQLAREALVIYESAYSTQNVVICAALYPLGLALLHQQKWDEAKINFQRIEALQTQLGRYDPVSLTAVIFNLAVIAQAQGHYQEAEQLRRRYLVMAIEKFGQRHFRVSGGLRALAETLISQKKYAEAIQLNQKALEIDRTIFGSDARSIGDSLYNLGVLEREAGHLQQALNHEEQALRIYAKTATADDPQQINVRIEKANILNRLQRFTEVKKLLVPLVERMRKTKPNMGYDLADGLTELGRAQSGLGETAKALANWNEALVLQRAKKPQDHEEIAELEKLVTQAQ